MALRPTMLAYRLVRESPLGKSHHDVWLDAKQYGLVFFFALSFSFFFFFFFFFFSLHPPLHSTRIILSGFPSKSYTKNILNELTRMNLVKAVPYDGFNTKIKKRHSYVLFCFGVDV